ncbi:MAG: HYR domain-containing protein [Actinomycetota bacterium]
MPSRELRAGWRATTVAMLAATAAVGAPLAGGGATKAAATLQLNGVLRIESLRDGSCPPGTRDGIVCPRRTGAGVVRGLGRVTESYSYVADTTASNCPAGFPRILGYPVRWVVEGKGEIHFAVAEHPDCLSEQAALSAPQSFTVTGGTGVYAGAGGGGTVSRALSPTDTGARGPETWTGTMTVSALEFDVTAPVIEGARAKTVRVPRNAKRAVVTYRVAAVDAADGRIPVSCVPASGRRFKVGRTLVRCTAEDSSGNSAAARFTVTVKRR